MWGLYNLQAVNSLWTYNDSNFGQKLITRRKSWRSFGLVSWRLCWACFNQMYKKLRSRKDLCNGQSLRGVLRMPGDIRWGQSRTSILHIQPGFRPVWAGRWGAPAGEVTIEQCLACHYNSCMYCWALTQFFEVKKLCLAVKELCSHCMEPQFCFRRLFSYYSGKKGH